MPDEDAPAAPQKSAVRGLFKRDMERQEQLLSFAAAGLAVVLGIVGALSTSPAKPGKHSSTTTTASPGLIIGLSCGLAVVMWLTARHGSRVATALVAMALFLTAFGGTILGIPYVVLGGWLLIRNSRSMREQRMAAQRKAGTTTAGGGRAGGGSRPEREPRQSRRARREAAEAEARRIEANKRYTPPTPRRRRPGR